MARREKRSLEDARSAGHWLGGGSGGRADALRYGRSWCFGLGRWGQAAVLGVQTGSKKAGASGRLRCETLLRQQQAKGSTAAPEQAHSPPGSQTLLWPLHHHARCGWLIGPPASARIHTAARAPLAQPSSLPNTARRPRARRHTPSASTAAVCAAAPGGRSEMHTNPVRGPVLRPRLYAKRHEDPASDYCTVAIQARNPHPPPSPAYHSIAAAVVIRTFNLHFCAHAPPFASPPAFCVCRDAPARPLILQPADYPY
ncbi:hypothetical protein PSPO01_05253 [Paraphaeosphaeria sporulosa]